MEVCLKTNFTVRRVLGIRFPFFGKYDFFSLLQQQNLFRTIKDIENMSADTLTASSRQFFERTKGKLAASIFAAAFGLVFLGFCAATGGQSQAAGDNAKDSSGDSKDAQNSLQSGFGFAAFCFILAFVIMTAGAIYISPLFCGSNNEKKILRAPQEVDSANYTAYSENPSAAAPQV